MAVAETTGSTATGAGGTGGAVPPTRTRILDAAEAEALRVGMTKLRVGHVAQAAGVSRQTIYNEFRDKTGLAEALAVRLAHRVVDQIEPVMVQYDEPAAGVAAAVLLGLRAASREPLIERTLMRGAADEMITLLTTNARAPLDAARERLRVIAARTWRHLPAEQIDLLVDVLTRQAFSSLVCPTEALEETARRAGELAAAVVERPARD